MTTATVAAKPAKQPKPLPAPNSDFYEVWIRHAVSQALLAGNQAGILTEPYGECRFAKPALGRRLCSFRIQNG